MFRGCGNEFRQQAVDLSERHGNTVLRPGRSFSPLVQDSIFTEHASCDLRSADIQTDYYVHPGLRYHEGSTGNQQAVDGGYSALSFLRLVPIVALLCLAGIRPGDLCNR